MLEEGAEAGGAVYLLGERIKIGLVGGGSRELELWGLG